MWLSCFGRLPSRQATQPTRFANSWGAPLVARATTDHGGVYFFATSAAANDSSLGTNGVALYVAIQRALASGAAQLSNARQLSAGDAFPRSKEPWRKLAGSKDALSTE